MSKEVNRDSSSNSVGASVPLVQGAPGRFLPRDSMDCEESDPSGPW